MKYKKFFPVMQAALGIVPLNKRELLPPPRRLWKSHHLTLHSDNTRRPVPLLLLLSSFSPSLPHSKSSTMRLGISGFITDILSSSGNICFCWADGKFPCPCVLSEHLAVMELEGSDPMTPAFNLLLPLFLKPAVDYEVCDRM
ncbi:tight junction protein ZO-2-like isoform X1 [Tachysurus ichikawai]